MSAVFRLTDPDEARFTLTITMPMKDWVKASNAMNSPEGVIGYPLIVAVREMVNAAEKRFYPSTETQGNLP